MAARRDDLALRMVPTQARRSAAGVAAVALAGAGGITGETIGAALALAYGAASTLAAIGVATLLLAVLGLAVARAATATGLAADLLARGAGFGHLGASLPGLVHACSSFLLLAIETALLGAMLALATGLPAWAAQLLALALVVPVAAGGIARLAPFALVTLLPWLVLQLAAGAAALAGPLPALSAHDVAMTPFGLALATLLALLPRLGMQADVLRFLPATGSRAALLTGSVGAALVTGVKLALGALLAATVGSAVPGTLFADAYARLGLSPAMAMGAALALVLLSALRANAVAAYSGSIAWTNFFAPLTHAHPGRTAWLLFNIVVALLLAEFGVLAALERLLAIQAVLAAGWIGAMAGDLLIARPLRLVPAEPDFRRAHLFDINPTGTGAMLAAVLVAFGALAGLVGPLAQAFAPVLGLAVAFLAAPALALAADGRFGQARRPTLPAGDAPLVCGGCGGAFQRTDMATCPFVGGTLCSQCCILEARCRDRCKTGASVGEQGLAVARRLLPARLAGRLDSSFGRFVAVMALFTAANAGLLWFIALQYGAVTPDHRAAIETALLLVFVALTVVSGVAAWLLVLAHDTRTAAEAENDRRTALLLDEIAGHARERAALKKAAGVAEAANQAKSRYLLGVSHEIRSPLNAIHGYAQLLERGSSIAPAEAARVIRRSSEHLSDLVEGLLDISRIEAGMLRLSRDLVPLPELLDQIVGMMRVQADEKGLAFDYAPAANLPAVVRVDEKRLRQLLINLLSNAIKYTPAGSVGLTVRYRSLVAEFEVWDTGLGIAPADQARIFEPFERGASPEARAQPGTGLGLAISRVLAQIMGGDIALASTPGRGSRFTLRLMLSTPGEVPTETLRPRPITGYRGPRRTILAIDDDPAQLTVLQTLLRPLGFDLFAAASGAAGLAMARHARPDLVLLDVEMPGMTGWETARRLRDELGPAIGILMVSGNAHEFAAGGDGAAAHDGFVLKPVTLDRLLDAIAARLELAWTRDEPAPVSPTTPDAAPTPRPSAAAPYLAELRRLGRVGHVRGIDAKLSELAADVPAAAALVERLRAPVRDFDLTTFLKLLDRADAE